MSQLLTTFPPRLENEIVILRPMQPEDIDAFAALTSETGMWAWFTSDLSDPDELKHWVNSSIDSGSCGNRIAYTVIDKASGRVAGSTSFGNYSARDKRIEIGWTWLGADFRGSGLNDAMKQCMLKYCFEDIDIVRVECKTDVLNTYARAALKRTGFTEEGILRSHTLMTHGRRRDTIYYALLRERWKQSP